MRFCSSCAAKAHGSQPESETEERHGKSTIAPACSVAYHFGFEHYDTQLWTGAAQIMGSGKTGKSTADYDDIGACFPGKRRPWLIRPARKPEALLCEIFGHLN